MAYDRSIPQPTNLISNSQGDLLANFQAIDSGTTGTGAGFSRNHVTLTDGTNGGLHSEIDFYQAISNPTVSGFVSSLFPKTISAATELCYTNTTGTVTQITSAALPIWKGGSVGGSGVVTSTLAQTGSMVLPNGLGFIWGRKTPGSDLTTVDFPATGAPGWPSAPSGGFLTACFQVQITPTSASTAASASSVQYISGFSKTGFTFRTASSSLNGFFWFAIGN